MSIPWRKNSRLHAEVTAAWTNPAARRRSSRCDQGRRSSAGVRHAKGPGLVLRSRYVKEKCECDLAAGRNSLPVSPLVAGTSGSCGSVPWLPWLSVGVGNFGATECYILFVVPECFHHHPPPPPVFSRLFIFSRLTVAEWCLSSLQDGPSLRGWRGHSPTTATRCSSWRPSANTKSATNSPDWQRWAQMHTDSHVSNVYSTVQWTTVILSHCPSLFLFVINQWIFIFCVTPNDFVSLHLNNCNYRFDWIVFTDQPFQFIEFLENAPNRRKKTCSILTWLN